ncbi:c-type cytochrome [Pedobacter gandavensis]|uniref:c-type cytochrome n=1 Tax=Pedobacter TaxID=84567 RepID=UPI001C99BF8F|nr:MULTISPECIES: c-type cytochrome [Pedobacter]WGQ12339.1 c-type cytochrome [Pedobacter gandavensis]
MKNTLFILACFISVLASCGSPESSSTSTTATTESAPAATSSSTEKHPGEKLIATSDCIGCHNKVTKVIGPTYEEIAAKYANDDATIEKLSAKIIEGGKGVWGEVPMTPHANLSKDDAKEMVRYILSLKK